MILFDSPFLSATPAPPPPPPATPTGLDISGSSTSSSILLSWNPQTPTPTHFEIWRSQNGGAFSLLTTISGSTTSASDTSGIGNGAVWSYKIRATNSGGASAFSTPADISNNIGSGTGTSFSRPNLVVALGAYSPPTFSSITTFQVPRLHDAGSIQLSTNSAPVALDFSSLVNCGNFHITIAHIVGSSLSFPALVTVNGELRLQNFGASTISLPNLTTVQSVLLINNLSVTSLSFPSLTSASAGAADVDFTGNSSLTSLSFPAALQFAPGFLGGGGYFGAGGNGGGFGASSSITTVSCPQIIFNDGNTIDFSTCSLNVASVNQILRRCVVSGLTSSTISLDGGTNAAPTGQGLIDKATLQAAGNFVTTN